MTYDGVDCTFGNSNMPDIDDNTQRCFPQKQGDETTWWSKYRVSQVVESDLVGGSPPVTHTYAYSTDGSSTAVLWGFNAAARYSTRVSHRTWSNWRGYSTVTVTTGTDAGQQSQTRSLYMRGMHGDRVEGNPGDGTRQAVITTSGNVALNDDLHLAGFLREQIVYRTPGGARVSQTVHDPWWQQTSLRNPTPTWAIPPTTRGGFLRTAASTTTVPLTRGYQDGIGIDIWMTRTTKTATTFDPTYGMPTHTDDLGDLATATDDVCTRLTYARNTTATWIVDKPSRAETVGVNCTTTASYPGDLISDSRSFFDGSTTFGTAPTRGLVTKTEQAKSHNGTTPTYITAAEASFDQWGRPLTAKDALARQTTTAYTHDTAGRVSQIKVTNPATHTLTTNLDTARGNPVTIVDANGKTTTGQYDTLGRLIKVWKPGHLTSGTPDAEYVYAISATAASHIETKTLGPNGNQISSYEIFDGLLRPRQTQSITQDGKRAITDTQYDKRGLQTKHSIFYNNAVPASTLVTFADTNVDRQTRYVYDGAGRPVKQQLFYRDQFKWETTTIHDGDRTSVIPPSGGTRTQDVYDARGRQVEKRQYESATAFTGTYAKTLYAYDDAGRLTTVTDPANNTWTYGYDLLGRKTSTTDPDAGTTTSTFDNAGQLTSTTDARNHTLIYEYDNLGRKTKQRDATTTGPVMAEWTYDTIAKGQLSAATRYQGTDAYTTRTTSYDDGYRPQHTETIIPTTPHNGALAGTYTVDHTYKPNGAPATTTLPAAGGLPTETLTHTYNTHGFAQTLTGTWTGGSQTYLADIVYHYDGLISQQLLGNPGKHVRHTAVLDAATRRLTAAHTNLETSPGTFTSKYIHDYTYDPTGNILSAGTLTDGVRDQVECFRYDHLRRLTEAWTQPSFGTGCTTPQRAGVDPYWRQWTFDTIGNRLTQTDLHPGVSNTTWTHTIGAAGGVKPHQVKQVDATGPLSGTPTRSFAYDNAGNTITATTPTGVAQTLTWDKENHLATVTENSTTTASYLYDADGRRLISRTPTTTTLYLPDGTELELAASGGPVLGTRYYAGTAVRNPTGLKWLCTNHQNTSVAQIDATTLTPTRRRILPYGEDRGTPPTTWMGTKGFVGGTKDPSGLVHLNAREYDPTLGRFISVDPIMDLTDPQQWHAYSYANGSPVTNSDPSGLAPICGIEGGGGDCSSAGGPDDSEGGRRDLPGGGGSGGSGRGGGCYDGNRSPSCQTEPDSGPSRVEINGITFEGVAPDAFTVTPCQSGAPVVLVCPATYSITSGESVNTYEGQLLGLCYQSGKCTTELVAYLIMTCGCYASHESQQEAGWAAFNRQAAATLVPKFYDPLPGGVYKVISTGDIVISLPNGEQYTIPSDWKARLADNGRGMVWQKADAIGGQYKDAHSIRIMEAKPGYPNGYVVVYNQYGQPIGMNGKPVGKAGWHFHRGPGMPFPKPIR